MKKDSFFVKAEWDDEAKVWYVSDTDFPGLAAEAETTEALLAKIRGLVRELYADNKHLIDWEPDAELPIHFMAEQIERIRITG